MISKYILAALPLLFLHVLPGKAQTSKEIDNIIVQSGQIDYYLQSVKEDFSVLFIADAHLAKEDERGKEYYSYTKRMGGSVVEPANYGSMNGRDTSFQRSLNKVIDKKIDLILLGGDILNFPSLALVEYVQHTMNSIGVPWMYTAGNHDWHYEGESGSSMEQRDRWTKSHLSPLYQGNNPLGYAKVVKGINFVCIDNTAYEIKPEQMALLKEEIKKGYPIILIMHIPLYLPGHTIDYTCGSPYCKRENDHEAKIERREPWPENGLSKLSFEFRDLIINTPSIIGILAGHTHAEKVDYFNNKIQYVAGPNFNCKDAIINFKSLKNK